MSGKLLIGEQCLVFDVQTDSPRAQQEAAWEQVLGWIRDHGQNPNAVYRIEAARDRVRFHLYATNAEGRKYADLERGTVATAGVFECPLLHPVPSPLLRVMRMGVVWEDR